MGLRELAPGGYQAAKARYGFNKDSYATLEIAAEEAVNRIYAPGMMLHDGNVIPGGNNVMADFAAEDFSEDDLTVLESKGALFRQFATVIRLRHDIMQHDNYYSDEALKLFQRTYDCIQPLKQQGWAPRNEIYQMNGPRPV